MIGYLMADELTPVTDNNNVTTLEIICLIPFGGMNHRAFKFVYAM
jgi:hypothetical protein